MMEVLEPLGRMAGVRAAVLVSPDGIPVFVRGRRKGGSPETGRLPEEDPASLAALAMGWLAASGRAVAPLSFEAPVRAVLRAERGTLVLLVAPASVLMVVLERGASADDLRLPMDGAVARMQRHLRDRRERAESQHAAVAAETPPEDASGPLTAALPSQARAKGPQPSAADIQEPHNPRALPG